MKRTIQQAHHGEIKAKGYTARLDEFKIVIKRPSVVIGLDLSGEQIRVFARRHGKVLIDTMI